MIDVPTVEQVISGLEEAGWRVAYDIPPEEALRDGSDFWFGEIDGEQYWGALSPTAQEMLALVRSCPLTPEEELTVMETPSTGIH